jgi:hypothetical protein
MALTWREERPEAMTAASHSAERPSRSMVMMFSALSSSSDVKIRFRRSLGGAGFFAGAAAFLGAGFLGASFFASTTGFLGAGFLAGLLAVFLAFLGADFLAGAFVLDGALDAAFLAGFLADFRGKVPSQSGRQVYHGLGHRTKGFGPEHG